MTVLITGATGFIGSHTASVLEKRGHKVISFNGDVRKISDWEKHLKDRISVLHLAAVRTETKKDFDTNVAGTENLFIAAQRTNKLPRKVVLASSQAVYMGLKPPFNEKSKPKPTTIYGKSKLKAEQVAKKWSDILGIDLVILRYSTVIGAGIRQSSKMSGPLNVWIKALKMDKPIKVFQDGNQTRDYIHVEDVVSANILAIETLDTGIYNVGGGKRMRLIKLAELVRRGTNRKSKIVITGGKPSLSDPKDLFSEIDKLKRWGWKPRKKAKEAVYEFINSYTSL